MPELCWRYRTAWLSDRISARCVALAEAWATGSPERVTRRLQAEWSGPTLRALACRTLVVGQRGDRIRDDTGIPKPVAPAMEGWAWVFSSQERRPVDGVSLGRRLWRRGGPATSMLAVAWRS
jgi:hypothetical protein